MPHKALFLDPTTTLDKECNFVSDCLQTQTLKQSDQETAKDPSGEWEGWVSHNPYVHCRKKQLLYYSFIEVA